MAPGRRVQLSGVVQGVGFRPWVYRLARQHGLRGKVWNHAGGVTIEAFGSPALLDAFIAQLSHNLPPAASLTHLSWEPIHTQAPAHFTIAASTGGEALRTSLPADLATCSACLAEIFDPHNRRYRYPFTNCTHCGPRFTIATALPYDRPHTSMGAFPLCAHCQREYEDPEDRRFHAQPNACPACGPQLRLLTSRGEPVPTDDPLRTTARLLLDGALVAIKGLGGYHLACDARSERVVRALRRRKHREAKPLAVMVPSLAQAEALGELTDEERTLLCGPQRPIVLVPRRPHTNIAAAVGQGSARLGLMLPYTPLHHLLMSEVEVPLVMTSANVSNEPMVQSDAEALRRLGPIADYLLVHNREIINRADDSVAMVIGGRPLVTRRARGFVPDTLQLARPVPCPILACGAHLKNTFCLAVNDVAFLGPHIGDLDSWETVESFRTAVQRLERFLQVEPQVFAHDLHPDFASTQYALQRAAARGKPAVAVQHHHAHVLSVMAEHRLQGPVLGVTYDGMGLGTDQTLWGGELLRVWPAGFERLGTLRPVQLAGGDRAVREPWRIALALLRDALGHSAPLDRLPLFTRVSHREQRVVGRMLTGGFNTYPAHGLGRYFDGVAALVLGRERARYEGELAVALEQSIDPAEAEAPPYPFELQRQEAPWQVDLRPMVRGLVGDLAAGPRPGHLAARFHNTIIAATVALLDQAAALYPELPVVLTGGCFQNAHLAEGLTRALGGKRRVYLPQRVPPGDGGVALGQILAAAAHRTP